MYHPLSYKKRYCKKYLGLSKKCEFGEYCSLAHSESELTAKPIHNYEFDQDFFIFHYKTVFCPFFDCVSKDCIYAHGWREYRRKPHLYNYEPSQCQVFV